MNDKTMDYVETRARLIGADHRDVAPVHAGRLKDPTLKLVAKYLSIQAEIDELQRETVRYVRFTPNGGVEVVDSNRLIEINDRLDELDPAREVLERVIGELAETAPGFLCDYEDALDLAINDVRDAETAIRRQLGIELTSFNAKDVDEAKKSRRYIETEEKYTARAERAEKNIEKLGAAIDFVSERLAACEAYTSNEPYKPPNRRVRKSKKLVEVLNK